MGDFGWPFFFYLRETWNVWDKRGVIMPRCNDNRVKGLLVVSKILDLGIGNSFPENTPENVWWWLNLPYADHLVEKPTKHATHFLPFGYW